MNRRTVGTNIPEDLAGRPTFSGSYVNLSDYEIRLEVGKKIPDNDKR